MTNQITCPKCQTKIDVEKVLADQISVNFEQAFLQKKKDLEAELENKSKKIENAQEQINKDRAGLNEELQKLLKAKETELRSQVKKELLIENETELAQLKKDNEEKSKKVKELQNQELNLRKEKQKLQEATEALGLEVQRRIDAERKEIEQNARKSEQQALQMTLKEKDLMLDKLSGELSDLQRKIEQGSVQSQGEVQEIELEKLLAATFPNDEIREVPKGVNGADCLQIVRNIFGQECGTIIYESKRTKNFGKDWIDKLKADMRAAKADVAILVTEVLPKDMSEFGGKDGVLICSFNEVRAISALVRDGVIKIAEVKTAQENRGEKVQALYSYLTSNAFFQHFQAVVTSFTKMKTDIEAEKRAMKTIWSRREKELDLVIDSTVTMYGTIKGIAGNAIGEIKELELPKDEVLKFEK